MHVRLDELDPSQKLLIIVQKISGFGTSFGVTLERALCAVIVTGGNGGRGGSTGKLKTF
ncbi:hypothetical protein HMPREF0293_0208 [Corynebacterium glucuronolyticum ATCC 51866]|uniref:Uncharacterized protein n=1 Tax=Corynebacterium glucuronolyticum ATCC 51866 TaxID=548478 RepID=A0ABM9XSE5_9CORY|nr:hypothetical protein HMPREF0293_0208 [Corynebacterium glucuronolyticum ATCC 51866]